MRKYIKKQLLDLLTSLSGMQEVVKAAVDKGESLMNLLAQQQEAAVAIGNQIETTEGEGTEAVCLLEEYCDLLWHMSQTGNKAVLMEQVVEVCNLIKRIEDSIMILPEQYEVVFLPYKASMWDCMESVWMAAKEDEDCTVKVVPIPYYDRNSDGSLAEMHYEGGEMPEYVEITHYNDYHIEEQHPDIIYIHNPYDGGNYVTCVHPKYFSTELKKCTDMLIYIPYFMSGAGPYPDVHWNLPAYQYVDKIIVQDEEKLEGLRQYVPEEKIVVAGSPKADRIRRLEGERQYLIDNVIPGAWRKKIQGKKVFLYNVSLSGILKHSDTAMDKIRYILEVFARRNDVVLLWRPHPLIESTLKTLRPSLYLQYRQLKEEFIKKDKGIYDETADVGISAAISDAYIGEDSSSVVHYFGVVGKGVLYTDWKVRRERTKVERKTMLVTDCFEEDGKLFFVPNVIGMEHMLFKLDLETGKIEKDIEMPGRANGIVEDTKYYDIHSMNKKVVLAGYNSEETYIYDRKVKRAVKLLLTEPGIMFGFDRTLQYNEKLFLKPKNYPAIVKLDVNTFEVTEYRECIAHFSRTNEEEIRFMWAYATKGNLLYMAAAVESRMLIFNMDDGSYEIKRIGNLDYGYFSMVYDGTYFWMAVCGKNCIIRWNEHTNEVIEILYDLDGYGDISQMESIILADAGETLLAFCMFRNIVIEMEKEDGSFKKYNLGECDNSYSPYTMEGNVMGATFVRNIDNKIVWFKRKDCSFVVWNKVTGEQRTYPVQMSSKDMYEKEKREIEKNGGNIWHALYDLEVETEVFIDYVIHSCEARSVVPEELYKGCPNDMERGIGENIYRMMKGFD